LIENVGEEAIDCVILGELLFKDEKVIHIVENSVEIRLE